MLIRTKLTYQKPTAAEIQAVKEEEKERKIFRDDINEKKSKVESSRQQALKDELPFVCIACKQANERTSSAKCKLKAKELHRTFMPAKAP